jgi:hypothetical protein
VTFDYKHFVLSHLIWIIAVAIALVGFHSWKLEHDDKLAIKQAEAVAEVQVKNLQQQIRDRDAESAQKVQTIVKVVHDVKTPEQAAQALPQVVTVPLPAPVETQPNGSWLVPQADVLPVFQQLADDKICREQLTTTTKDLVDTKAIVVARDTEIKTLKKPRGFWGHVKDTAKDVGIGVGIGFMLGKKF